MGDIAHTLALEEQIEGLQSEILSMEVSGWIRSWEWHSMPFCVSRGLFSVSALEPANSFF